MTDDDQGPVGTVRWWGESWGAPICDPRNHVATPVTAQCAECGLMIRAGHRGVSVPTVLGADTEAWEYRHWHLECWLKSMGIPVAPAALRTNGPTKMAAVRMPADLHERLDQLAFQRGQSRSQIMIEAMYLYLEEQGG